MFRIKRDAAKVAFIRAARSTQTLGGLIVATTTETELRDLALKLLSTFHLNVPERKSVPPNGLPFSALVDVVESKLSNGGWFPAPVNEGAPPIGEGARIEVRNGNVWLHEQHEIGVGRYSDIVSRRVSSIRDAVAGFVRANGGAPIDGVSIDWSH